MNLKSSLLLLLLVTSCSRPPALQRPTPSPVTEEADPSHAPAGKYGGRLIEAVPGEPKTLNPLVASDASSNGVIGLLTSGLTTYDPVREEVQPGLAKRWEIGSDSKTFTFYLHEGLRFSDGHPLTADDVLFSFQCMYDPRFPTRLKDLYSVDGKPFLVEKINATTVRITTPDIFAPFLQMIGGVEILPRHKLQSAFDDGSFMKTWTVGTAQTHPEEIVGTGICKLVSYHPGERIVLTANPHYPRVDSAGQRLPYFDHYIIKFVPDINSCMVQFATGQCDSVDITPGNVAWIRAGEKPQDYKVHDRGPSTSSSFLWFNQNPGKDKDGKPFVPSHKLAWFQEQKFRQAISYGIDRAGIVEGVLFGRGAPLWGPESPANRKWFNPDLMTYPFQPEKSMELFASLGMKKDASGTLRDSAGNAVAFSLVTNKENQIRQDMATVFKENMQGLGIEVTLQFLDFGTFVGKIQDSYDYEAGILGFTGGGDPVGGMSIYPSSGRMHQWNPKQKTPATPWEARIDTLMSQQLRTLDLQKRQAAYFEVQRIMSEQLPLIYLITPNAYVGIKNRWKNLEIPRVGSVLWNLDCVWTDQP